MSAEVIPAEVFRVLRATDDVGRTRPIEPCEVVILPVVRVEAITNPPRSPRTSTRRKTK